MAGKISRCIIYGNFFYSKKELKEHKDKYHRITNPKINQVPANIISHNT
jgi:hypothetical protein